MTTKLSERMLACADSGEADIYRRVRSLIRDMREFAAEVAALESAPADPTKFDTPAVVEYIAQYGNDCRDCADDGPVCPSSGLPCAGRARAIRFVLEALDYGLSHGYIAARQAPAATGEQEEAARWFEDEAIGLDLAAVYQDEDALPQKAEASRKEAARCRLASAALRQQADPAGEAGAKVLVEYRGSAIEVSPDYARGWNDALLECPPAAVGGGDEGGGRNFKPPFFYSDNLKAFIDSRLPVPRVVHNDEVVVLLNRSAWVPTKDVEYGFDLYQNDEWTAGATGPREDMEREAAHYAMMYGQGEGEVRVEFYMKVMLAAPKEAQ